MEQVRKLGEISINVFDGKMFFLSIFWLKKIFFHNLVNIVTFIFQGTSKNVTNTHTHIRGFGWISLVFSLQNKLVQTTEH